MTRRRVVWISLGALVLSISGSAAQRPGQKVPDTLLGEALHQEQVEGDVEAAIASYRRIVEDARASRALVATALLRLGQAYEKLGNVEARKAYDRVVREYADQQSIVSQARTRLAALSAAGSTRESGIVARQIWSGDNAWAGLPSPDGRYLPWISGPKQMLRDVTTGTDRVIDASPGAAYGVGVFSPDGRQFIYGWYEEGTWNYLLKVVDVTGAGSKPRLLHRTDYYRADFEEQFYDMYPGAVSPDGRMLSVSGGVHKSMIIAHIDVASGQVTVLKTIKRIGAFNLQIGNYSPDGKYLVYSGRHREDSEDREIHVMAVDGSTDVVVASPPGANNDPFFTPDGSRIVFTSNRSGQRWDLWAVRVEAGKTVGAPAVLKRDIGQVTNLGFTRDATFYYRAPTIEQNALTVHIDTATLRPTGPPQRVSNRFVDSTFAPSWSPDGKSLAYVANPGHVGGGVADSGDFRYIVRALDSGQERDFVVPFARARMAASYRWFPDSKSLLLIEWDNFTYFKATFRRLDLATGQIHSVAEVEASNQLCGAAVSSDGTALLFTRRDPGGSVSSGAQWIRRDVDKGDERIVFHADGQRFHPSSDGTQMLFFKDWSRTPVETSAWIAPVAGGDARMLQRPPNRFFANRTCAAWDPQHRGIFMALAPGEFSTNPFNPIRSEPQEIWYVPTDGSAPRNTGIAMQQLQTLAIRPDGRQLGFTGGTSSAQVWTLTNLLPGATPTRTDPRR